MGGPSIILHRREKKPIHRQPPQKHTAHRPDGQWAGVTARVARDARAHSTRVDTATHPHRPVAYRKRLYRPGSRKDLRPGARPVSSVRRPPSALLRGIVWAVYTSSATRGDT